MHTDTDVIEKVKLKIPKKWAIVLHNDDTTPMDFVVELLYHVFKMKIEQATKLMITIHTEGKGVVGIFSFEIAEQKHLEAKTHINSANMALQITLEEE
jgi:ATP-dependent Clp protease adaptor protein ClpS